MRENAGEKTQHEVAQELDARLHGEDPLAVDGAAPDGRRVSIVANTVTITVGRRASSATTPATTSMTKRMAANGVL
jgi:Flp pilus assembly CpaF family ATPase